MLSLSRCDRTTPETHTPHCIIRLVVVLILVLRSLRAAVRPSNSSHGPCAPGSQRVTQNHTLIAPAPGASCRHTIPTPSQLCKTTQHRTSSLRDSRAPPQPHPPTRRCPERGSSRARHSIALLQFSRALSLLLRRDRRCNRPACAPTTFITSGRHSNRVLQCTQPTAWTVPLRTTACPSRTSTPRRAAGRARRATVGMAAHARSLPQPPPLLEDLIPQQPQLDFVRRPRMLGVVLKARPLEVLDSEAVLLQLF